MSYAKGAAQLALDPGTAPDALTAAVAGLGYKAMLADAPPTDNRTGLFDKVRGWMGAADKGSGGRAPVASRRDRQRWSRDGGSTEGRRARRAGHAD